MDEIRLYLFWGGQSLRFYPQDIVDVLPRLFDNDYGKNRSFASSMESKRMTNGIMIQDKYFEHFYNDLTSKKWYEFPTRKYKQSNGCLWTINEDLVYATIRHILLANQCEDPKDIPQEIDTLIRKYFCYY